MKATRPMHHRQHGVSLVEALVALAVMAFGILGVVGIQATLRSNADTSRQRGEAVRLAQQAVEDARSFNKLNGLAPSYSAIQPRAAVSIADPDPTHIYSTTYRRELTVAPLAPAAAPAGAGVPQAKVLSVVVSWEDRASQPQQVRMVTNIAGVSPELAGSLGLSGDGPAAVRRPRGRNRAIPQTAVIDAGNGTSTFTPPGGTGVTWVFNNTTGVITSICMTSVCTVSNAYLLSGYVRFALGGDPAAQSANPSSPVPPSPFALNVVVDTTAPTNARTACFGEAFPTYVAYYCAVTVSTVIPGPPTPLVWTGTSRLVIASRLISTAFSDAVSAHVKVCRYTPGRDEDINGDTYADGDRPLRGNVDHPREYQNVNGPLTNQNFLVISAGNDATAFVCPERDPNVPVNTNTWRHQPPES